VEAGVLREHLHSSNATMNSLCKKTCDYDFAVLFFPIILVSGGRIHQPQPIEIQKIQDGENYSFEGKKKKIIYARLQD
jgi:hypothetical protein